MSAKNFKVGDRARVRKWEDMDKEFGLLGEDINTPVWLFTYAMRRFCGKIVKISAVFTNRYDIDDNAERFTDEMLEPIPAQKWYVGQEVWDDVLCPGIKGTISGVYDSGVIEVAFDTTTYYYNYYYTPTFRLKIKTLSAVPYTFELPPQPEPVWIPEKWERVLVRNSECDTWKPHIFFKNTGVIQYPFQIMGEHGGCWKYCIPFDVEKVGKV